MVQRLISGPQVHSSENESISSQIRYLVQILKYPESYKAPEELEGRSSIREALQRYALSNSLERRNVLNLLLQHSKVPQNSWKYFDAETGHFQYDTAQPKILSVENGDEPLKAIRLGLAHTRYEGNVSAGVILDYIDVLDRMPSLELWILHGSDFKNSGRARYLKYLFPARSRGRVHLINSRDDDGVNMWTQDATKPLSRRYPTSLLPQVSQETTHYLSNVNAMAAAEFVDLEKSDFIFEGGDIVVGAQNVFVGTRTIVKNMKYYHITRSETISALSNEFAKPVIEVGAPSGPEAMSPIAFHADLSVIPVRNRITGREEIFLDSPDVLFSTILGIHDWRSLSEVEFRKRLAGAIQNELASYRKTNGELQLTMTEKDLLRVLPRLNLEQIKLRQLQLDFLEQRLQRIGYSVTKLPGLTLLDEPQMKNDGLFNLSTFNFINSILSRQFALVPKTGVRFLDLYAAKVYEHSGYEVIGMKSAAESFCLSGGPRCAAETFRSFPGRMVRESDAQTRSRNPQTNSSPLIESQ